jgi:hypothetical protein
VNWFGGGEIRQSDGISDESGSTIASGRFMPSMIRYP